MRGRLFPILLAAVLISTCLPGPGLAQALVTEEPVEYIFGETIIFKASLQSDTPVREVLIFFQSEGDTHTEVRPAAVTTHEGAPSEIRYVYSLAGSPLRPFSRVNYHYQVMLEGGESYTSPDFSFYYEDNRFEWQVLEEQPFRVHWFEGDIAFGQKVLDVAQAGLRKAETILPESPPEWVDIYAYASATQMQATLDPTRQSWVAGHANPDLGVMVVALPSGPDQRLIMEQRIPHELMHIMQYQSLGTSYSVLPTWLTEGLASASELYPNPDYQVLLNNAQQKDALLPIASLCEDFPRDASNALLAYAESASFVRYLHKGYGTSGLRALVDTYANGLDCRRGIETALGQSLNRIERQWRQEAFAEQPYRRALDNLLPWMALMVATLSAPFVLIVSRLRRSALSQPAN